MTLNASINLICRSAGAGLCFDIALLLTCRAAGAFFAFHSGSTGLPYRFYDCAAIFGVRSPCFALDKRSKALEILLAMGSCQDGLTKFKAVRGHRSPIRPRRTSPPEADKSQAGAPDKNAGFGTVYFFDCCLKILTAFNDCENYFLPAYST